MNPLTGAEVRAVLSGGCVWKIEKKNTGRPMSEHNFRVLAIFGAALGLLAQPGASFAADGQLTLVQYGGQSQQDDERKRAQEQQRHAQEQERQRAQEQQRHAQEQER